MRYHLLCTAFLCALSMMIYMPADASKRKSALDTSVCDKASIKFDDGDSFSCDGENIRVLGIDTPEIIHKSQGISENQEKGVKAAAFTKKLIKAAKRVVIIRAGTDKYGRTLAHVLLDGELFGIKLIKAGLAYETVSRYGDNGMPEFALEFTEAAKVSPKPAFEDPYLWRKKHQVKM